VEARDAEKQLEFRGLRRQIKKKKKKKSMKNLFLILTLFSLAAHVCGEVDRLEFDVAYEGADEFASAWVHPRAQVMLLDVDLIRRDFPQLSFLNDAQLEHWFMYETAYSISSSLVNAPPFWIPDEPMAAVVDPRFSRKLFRRSGQESGAASWLSAVALPPTNWSAIEETVGVGLVELKGVGRLPKYSGRVENGVKIDLEHVDRMHASLRNGYMLLPDAMREFAFQKLAAQLVGESSTVGIYGVLALRFMVDVDKAFAEPPSQDDALGKALASSPSRLVMAGVVVRQPVAHGGGNAAAGAVAAAREQLVGAGFDLCSDTIELSDDERRSIVGDFDRLALAAPARATRCIDEQCADLALGATWGMSRSTGATCRDDYVRANLTKFVVDAQAQFVEEEEEEDDQQIAHQDGSIVRFASNAVVTELANQARQYINDLFSNF
jgi:hypothetical protein